MSDDRRALADRAFTRARASAYGTGEFVGQEGFMRASEILDLAVRAGIAPGATVLDLCCGVAGPGRLITRELGCTYRGMDASAPAIRIARRRAGGLGCRFEVSRIPPLPRERFDVVLLLETMLAFPDKEALLRDVRSTLTAGGRFAFTLEEGSPLTGVERGLMPAAETVWPIPLSDMLARLDRAGLRVRWLQDRSASHRTVVDSLVDAIAADRSRITEQAGGPALDELLTAHRLWGEWLRVGRVRKYAFVVESATRAGS